MLEVYFTLVFYHCNGNEKCMEETIQTSARCGTSSTHVWKGYMKYMLITEKDIEYER